jgi:predicted Zn finger-like uncharacterized protein
MKFVCDKCHTKYSIADERVRGRVLKIRCKSCSNVITVREEPKGAVSTPAAASTATGARPRPMQHTQPIDRLLDDAFAGPGGLFASSEEGEHTMVSQGPPGAAGAAGEIGNEWYVSFDGEQEGPMSLDAAIARVRAERPKGREAHCWNPTFFVWKPVEEVPELAPALAPARPPAAPPAIPSSSSGARGLGRSSSSPSPSHVGTASPSPSPSSSSSAATGPSASAGGGTGRRAGLAVGAVATAEALPAPDPMPQMPPQVTRPETRAALRGTPARTPEGPYARPAVDKERAGALPSSQATSLPDKPRSGAPPLPGAVGSSTGPAKAIPAPSSMKASGKAPAIPDVPSTKASGKAPAIPDAPSTKASGKAPAIPEPQRDVAPTVPSPLGPAPVADAAPAPAPKVDTGPTPLPPPPGGGANDDLVISEPSGLFNLAHLAADLARTSKAASSPPTPARPAQPTPAPATAARGSAAAAPAGGLADDVISAGPVVPNAAPVVVVAGPAVAKTPPWVKWAAIGGLVVSLGLGGALIAVLVKRDPAQPVAPQPEPPVTRRADDSPIAVADPGAVPTAAAAQKQEPRATSGVAKKGPAAPKGTAPAPSDKDKGKGLSETQRNLAALYAEGGDHNSPRELPAVDRSSRPAGGQVSQNAILGVVTQNRRSLNLCYDRVLKRDSSLKRARLVTHVKVGISGSVVGVSIADPEYAKSEIGTCITQAVKHWHFPANDSEYETEFPIILQAD